MPRTSRLPYRDASVDYSSKRRKLITSITSHTMFTLVKGANIGLPSVAPASPGPAEVWPAGGSRRYDLVQEAAVTQQAAVTRNAGAGPGAIGPPSRRDRLRAATVEEIIQTARELIVRSGPEAASLRAIAREMGMTAPGLYRYFG